VGFDMHQACNHSEFPLSPESISILIQGGLATAEELVSQAERRCGERRHFPDHPLPPQWERRVRDKRSYFMNKDGLEYCEPPPYTTTDHNGGDIV
jgi:hypothetical protein